MEESLEFERPGDVEQSLELRAGDVNQSLELRGQVMWSSH